MCSTSQIRHPDSNKVLDIYVMLGNCSQDTFEIIEALGITRAETRVTVKTLNGGVSQMTTVVKNLKIAGSLGKPRRGTTTKSINQAGSTPVDQQEIATPEKVKKWN